MQFLICAILGLAALPLPAFAWGPEGHVVIAMIAEERLSPDVRQAVRKILSGAPLSTASIFADEYRVTHPETGRWHYVNIPFDKPYDEKRDCATLSPATALFTPSSAPRRRSRTPPPNSMTGPMR